MTRAAEARYEDLDPRVQAALDELRGVIAEHYPQATFAISRGHDEPENIHLVTTLDLDDPDEVLDLVGHRLDQLQVDERIPVHVIPVRTPERLLAAMQDWRERGQQHPRRTVPLFGDGSTATRARPLP